MKKAKNIISIILILFVCIPTYTLASGIDVNDYKPSEIEIPETPLNMATTIINTIAVIGSILSVVILIIMGLKYMMGSVSEKADYKKTMIPYLIGAVMIFGITQFLRILADLVASVE